MRANLQALPDFLKELDVSLKAIPRLEFKPVHFTGPKGPSDDFVGYAVAYADDMEVCFCALGDIPQSSDRAVALAHLLSNIHKLRTVIDRQTLALDEAIKALTKLSETEEARKALNEIGAIKDQAIK